MPQTSQSRPTLRADKEPFTLPDFFDTPQDLGLTDGHGCALTVTQGTQHQGITDGTGDAQAGRYRGGVLPGLGPGGAALKGAYDRGTTSRLHGDHAWSV